MTNKVAGYVNYSIPMIAPSEAGVKDTINIDTINSQQQTQQDMECAYIWGSVYL